MKKKPLLTSAAAALTFCMLFSGGLAYAKNGEGPGFGAPEEGMHQNWIEDGGPGPEKGFPGDKKFKGSKAKRGPDFEKLFKDIGVSEEQQVKLKEEREEHLKAIDALQKKLHENRKTLGDELDKEISDKNKLESISAEMKSIMSEMVDQRLNSALKVKEILTPEQYQKFVQHRKDHWKGRKELKDKKSNKKSKNK